MASTLDAILEEVSRLSLEEQEMLDEILHKRIIEEKREEIYRNYQDSLSDYKKGQIKTGTVKDLFNGINK